MKQNILKQIDEQRVLDGLVAFLALLPQSMSERLGMPYALMSEIQAIRSDDSQWHVKAAYVHSVLQSINAGTTDYTGPVALVMCYGASAVLMQTPLSLRAIPKANLEDKDKLKTVLADFEVTSVRDNMTRAEWDQMLGKDLDALDSIMPLQRAEATTAEGETVKGEAADAVKKDAAVNAIDDYVANEGTK